MKGKKEEEGKTPYEVGKNYFIRTVTMNYTGRLVRITDGELVLADCCWIADTGSRLHRFLQGEYVSNTEIEPFGEEVIVPRTSIIDATLWTVALPKEAR